MHVYGVFDVFEVIYIYAYVCISNFEMQGIKKNKKKENEAGPLPCVCTRQRTFGHIAVCIHMAKRPRGARLCSLVCLATSLSCVFDGICTTKVAAHSKAWHARQSIACTTKQGCTAMTGRTTKDPSARQRTRCTTKVAAHRKAWVAW
jgi:hypothetical protein